MVEPASTRQHAPVICRGGGTQSPVPQSHGERPEAVPVSVGHCLCVSPFDGDAVQAAWPGGWSVPRVHSRFCPLLLCFCARALSCGGRGLSSPWRAPALTRRLRERAHDCGAAACGKQM